MKNILNGLNLGLVENKIAERLLRRAGAMIDATTALTATESSYKCSSTLGFKSTMHLSKYSVIFLVIFVFVVSAAGLSVHDYDDEKEDEQRQIVEYYRDVLQNEYENEHLPLTLNSRPNLAKKASDRDLNKGLYSSLKEHPVLMAQRLWASSPRIVDGVEKRTQPNFGVMNFQHMSYGDMVSVCPTTKALQQLIRAHDEHDMEVTVIQSSTADLCHDLIQHEETDRNWNQYFYTVTCDPLTLLQKNRNRHHCRNCCIGTDDRMYNSRCVQHQSYVMALIKRPGAYECEWNYIKVDSSCNCGVVQHTI